MAEREQVVLHDRYALQRRVGRGGMAEVFLAHDRLLDRSVAVKILFPQFATDPAFVARFKREAQAAAKLNHPNVVGVYDWGQELGTYFIVMEYIDGRTVSDIIRKEGPLPAEKAARIAADVAAALGFAHQNGVVHRDVKPGNIILTRNGEVKVADFGIARALTATSEDNLTQTGSVMGTATYFSPEQAQGKAVDPRSDLYSLGVVLYEMASGRPPFHADSPIAIAYKHVQEPLPPLHDKAPGVPAAYEAITHKALAKDPDRRYPDAKAMRADLLRFVQHKPLDPSTTAPTVPRRAEPRTPPQGSPSVPLPPAEPEVARPAGKTSWFFAAVIGLLIVLAGVLFLFARELGVFNDAPKRVKVTNVVQEQFEDAKAELEGLGFRVRGNPVESDLPDNVVISQDPKGDTMADEGSTVTLTYSKPAGTAALPDLRGQLAAVAQAELARLGFLNVTIHQTETTDPVSAGRVMGQTPTPGDYPPDVAINLEVGTAPATTTTGEPATTQPEATTTHPPQTTSPPPPPVTTTIPKTTTTAAETTTTL